MTRDVSTDTGRRMLRAVTNFYEDPYQLAIFDATGVVMEEVLDAVHKIKTETLINNAAWSLPYWEDLFQLKASDEQTLEQRRRNVILKMNEYFPVTRQRMEAIVEAFMDGGEVKIDDERGDYIFEILLDGPDYVDLEGMIRAVEETKPAHLGYKFGVNNYSGLFVGGFVIGNEHVISYPYIEEVPDIESVWSAGGTIYESEKVEVEGDFNG